MQAPTHRSIVSGRRRWLFRVAPTWPNQRTTRGPASDGAQPGCGSADVFDGLQQREVQYIALGVAAADAMCQRRQAGQQANRAWVVAASERHYSLVDN
jgi:hypothetical protein